MCIVVVEPTDQLAAMAAGHLLRLSIISLCVSAAPFLWTTKNAHWMHIEFNSPLNWILLFTLTYLSHKWETFFLFFSFWQSIAEGILRRTAVLCICMCMFSVNNSIVNEMSKKMLQRMHPLCHLSLFSDMTTNRSSSSSILLKPHKYFFLFNHHCFQIKDSMQRG